MSVAQRLFYTITDATREQRDHERRKDNRARFFKQRLRASLRQSTNHLSIGGRISTKGGPLAIEMAENLHRWDWWPR